MGLFTEAVRPTSNWPIEDDYGLAKYPVVDWREVPSKYKAVDVMSQDLAPAPHPRRPPTLKQLTDTARKAIKVLHDRITWLRLLRAKLIKKAALDRTTQRAKDILSGLAFAHGHANPNFLFRHDKRLIYWEADVTGLSNCRAAS
jgi:hypothetical protein